MVVNATFRRGETAPGRQPRSRPTSDGPAAGADRHRRGAEPGVQSNTIGPGALMPDNEGLRHHWMPRRAAEAAFRADGRFSNAAARHRADLRGPTRSEVIAQVGPRAGTLYAGTRGALRPRGTDLQRLHRRRDQRSCGTLAYILPAGVPRGWRDLPGEIMGGSADRRPLSGSEVGPAQGAGLHAVRTSAFNYLLLAGLIAAHGGGRRNGRRGMALPSPWPGSTRISFDFPYLVFNVRMDTHLAAALIGFGRGAGGRGAGPPPPRRGLARRGQWRRRRRPRYRKTLLEACSPPWRLSHDDDDPAQPECAPRMRAAPSRRWGWALPSRFSWRRTSFPTVSTRSSNHAFFQTYRQDAMLLFGQERAGPRRSRWCAPFPACCRVEGQRFRPATLSLRPVRSGLQSRRARPGRRSRGGSWTGRRVHSTRRPGGMLLSQSLADSSGWPATR